MKQLLHFILSALIPLHATCFFLGSVFRGSPKLLPRSYELRKDKIYYFQGALFAGGKHADIIDIVMGKNNSDSMASLEFALKSCTDFELLHLLKALHERGLTSVDLDVDSSWQLILLRIEEIKFCDMENFLEQDDRFGMQHDSLSVSYLFQLFESLKHLQITWSKLSKSTQLVLENSINLCLSHWITHSDGRFANFINLLFHMRLNYGDLRSSTKNSFIMALLTNLKNSYDDFPLPSFLYSLSKIGFNFENMEPQQQNKFKIYITKLMIYFNKNSYVKIMRSLASMGLRWSKTDVNLRAALERPLSLLNSSPEWNCLPRDAFLVFTSLQSMKVLWTDLGTLSREALLSLASSNAAHMIPREFSGMLFCLGSMGLKWVDFPPTLRSALSIVLSSTSSSSTSSWSTMSAWDLAECVLGLGMLHTPLTSIHIKNLIDVLTMKASYFSHSLSAELALGLGLMITSAKNESEDCKDILSLISTLPIIFKDSL